jgi:hypothetical protein
MRQVDGYEEQAFEPTDAPQALRARLLELAGSIEQVRATVAPAKTGGFAVEIVPLAAAPAEIEEGERPRGRKRARDAGAGFVVPVVGFETWEHAQTFCDHAGILRANQTIDRE